MYIASQFSNCLPKFYTSLHSHQSFVEISISSHLCQILAVFFLKFLSYGCEIIFHCFNLHFPDCMAFPEVEYLFGSWVFICSHLLTTVHIFVPLLSFFLTVCRSFCNSDANLLYMLLFFLTLSVVSSGA